MHPGILLFVLLFLPNTSLQSWRDANAPNLHQLMADGSIGLMNARTAETDKITTTAGELTIFAGERVDSRTDAQNGVYSAADDNLEDGLTNAGIDLSGRLPMPQTPLPFYMPPSPRRFIVDSLSGDLDSLDGEIGKYADLVNKNEGVLMIVSPNPSGSDYKKEEQLTPVLLYGDGISPGYLSSSSTRTAGLVTNTDIAPTIAALTGASLPLPPYGDVINAAPSPDDRVNTLLQREAIWVSQAEMIKYLPYIAGIIAALILIALFAARSSVHFGKLAALSGLLPLVLLLSTTPPIFLGILALSAVIAFVVLKPVDTAFFAAVSLSTMVAVDLFVFGGRLTAGSMLGYSPIEGARYYGIGNEIMGAYIGSLAVITAVWDKPGNNRNTLLIMWAVAALSLALPTAGSKAGGLIVCAVTLAAYISVGAGKKLTDWVTISGMAGAVGAAVVILILLSHFGPATHVSDTLRMAETGGAHTIIDTIGRKAGMDIHLVYHSVWIWVLAFTSAGRLWLRSGSVASKVGTAAVIACLLFNDTGVVAAAICNLIIWAAEFNGVSDASVSPPAIPIEAAEV
jgi:hypothetical protein